MVWIACLPFRQTLLATRRTGGVLPSHRGRGLARALLQEAFSRDLARGLSLTKLNVDGLHATSLALYDGVGEVVEKGYRKWAKVR